MKKVFVIAPAFLLSVVIVSSCASAQNMNSNHMDHHTGTATSEPVIDSEMQDWAKQRLAKSPRHQEWVKIKYKPAGGNAEREVSAFVVYPEVKSKATSVLVIHEIFGMSDWVQSLTDQLAEAGYVAIAPDLLSGMGSNGGGTSEIRAIDSNAVGKAIRDLPPDLPVGWPVQVSYTYEANGRLHVAAKLKGHHASVTTDFVRENSLPDEDVDLWAHYVKEEMRDQG